ncbi:MAG: hypothetical protein L0G80_19525 [Shewanella sp.]|uniref:hypothetical protein n=1 Tax=Shewanella sp. TaxID=50422 RepID=UPI0026473C78|nr:hypothetical protein [Shewanella sp.]MDN5502090.1 hypothetical protein [Shewanella sp.]
MVIQRKQIQDEKVPATKHAKKKSKKSNKVKSTSLAVKNKHATKNDGLNKPFPKSKLVSALFNNVDDFKSAFDGEFELSDDHVKQLGCIVKTSQTELKQALLIIYKNKGYKKLGCADFKAYVENYLTISYDVALKQVWAASVAYVVNGLDAIGFYSDNSMLPMKDLSDDQIKDVVKHIEEEHGEDITLNGKYTRNIVEAAMRSLGLLKEDDSDEYFEVDDEVEEEDDLDFDDSNNAKAKQSSVDKVEQSKSHRQFKEIFRIKSAKRSNIKTVFKAFIETDAGKNQAILAKAIEFLMKQQISVMTLEAKAILEAQDE